MANPVDVRDVLATQVNTLFSAANPTIDLFFENRPMDRADNEIFVICEILPGENMRADLNNSSKLIRSMGVLNFRVMVPQETGKRAGQLVLDSLYEILTDRQFSIGGGGHVTIYGAEMNTRGEVNGYFAMGISFEYRAFITLVR
jgi:hypothetical protein